MRIRQTPAEEIAAIFSMTQETVVTAEGAVSTVTHRSASFEQIATAEYHFEYTVKGGEGDEISVVSQSVANALDISDWPKVQRSSGVNAQVTAKISNGRSTTEDRIFDFRTFNATSFTKAANAATPGSLLAITADIVDDLASAMTSNAMWDSSGNRAQTSVIPHEFLTGHVWNGGWGIPGVSGGGRRFMAITPRHLAACGHYQYYVGETLYWKDINNNIISRTVQAVVNFASELAASGLPSYDISIYLLNADLPESIYILPVMGAWGKGVVSETSETFTFCKQLAGITLTNNDGHLQPFLIADHFDETVQKNGFTYQGLEFDRSKVFSFGGVSTRTTIKNWPSAAPGDKFYHNLRGGDSGSPCLVPCNGGWCYASHISTGNHPTAAFYNDLIEFIDARAGVSTGHTVTEASAPTL